MHLIRNARLPAATIPLDVAIADGRIAAIGERLPHGGPSTDAGGRLLCTGLVETHIHLDKSRILDRCPCHPGSVDAAIRAVAQAKRGFTEEDVYARAEATLRRAILHGVQRMRTHVEVDARVGLTSVRALQRLKRDYAWAIDLELCCFPQEGLIDDPGADETLVAALEAGCDLIGGAPYVDRDPSAQIARIFELARRYGVDIDLHLDNTLAGDRLDALEVCRRTEAAGLGGRVAIGHVTKLATYDPAALAATAAQLASAGVALTVLPATDLFMMGRGQTHDVPRGVAPAHTLREHGVTCSLATNNVLNPFTPYGDGSLIRVANLYANVAQLGSEAELEACFAMITTDADRLLRRQRALEVGAPADLVLLDADSPAAAIAEIALPLAAWKAGRQTIDRPAPRLLAPPAASDALTLNPRARSSRPAGTARPAPTG